MSVILCHKLGHNYKVRVKGFHILTLRNKGERWVPREWWKLKSYINGKKTYFKGMEPKS